MAFFDGSQQQQGGPAGAGVFSSRLTGAAVVVVAGEVVEVAQIVGAPAGHTTAAQKQSSGLTSFLQTVAGLEISQQQHVPSALS
jgi:hypothetical protein